MCLTVIKKGYYVFLVNLLSLLLIYFLCKNPLYSEDLKDKYSKAESNLTELKRLGATLLHGVDKKKMKLHPDLKNRRFDRIIFNLPHAGFKGKEDDLYMIKYVHNLVYVFGS
jgi:25S rRNA (uracil2634-N3)-methyltransferase